MVVLQAAMEMDTIPARKMAMWSKGNSARHNQTSMTTFRAEMPEKLFKGDCVRIAAMETKPANSVWYYLPLALLLLIIGGAGLIYILATTAPSGGTRWAFFFLLFTALTGAAIPVMAFLNLRFPSRPPAGAWVVVRQSIWCGLYLPALAWLQAGRVLTLPMAVLLAAGLILIEFLLRLRERSQWKP